MCTSSAGFHRCLVSDTFRRGAGHDIVCDGTELWSSTDTEWTCDMTPGLLSPRTTVWSMLTTSKFSNERTTCVTVKRSFGSNSAANAPYLFVRVSNSTNFIAAGIDNAGVPKIVKVEAGAFSTLGSSAAASASAGNYFHSIKVNDENGTMTAYVDDVPKFTVSSAFLGGVNTAIGVGASYSVGCFKDFYCYRSNTASSGSEWFPFTMEAFDQSRDVNAEDMAVPFSKNGRVQGNYAGARQLSINGHVRSSSQYHPATVSANLNSVDTVLYNFALNGWRAFIHGKGLTTSGLPFNYKPPQPKSIRAAAAAFELSLVEDATSEWED